MFTRRTTMRYLASVLVFLAVVGLGRAGEMKDIWKALKDAGVEKTNVIVVAPKEQRGHYYALDFHGVRGTDALLSELCELPPVQGLDLEAPPRRHEPTPAPTAPPPPSTPKIQLSLTTHPHIYYPTLHAPHDNPRKQSPWPPRIPSKRSPHSTEPMNSKSLNELPPISRAPTSPSTLRPPPPPSRISQTVSGYSHQQAAQE